MKSVVSPVQKSRPPAARRRVAGSAAREQPIPRDRGSLRLAHQHILAQIAAGELPSGTALSELPLAAQLGISRTPVREAIGQLVAEGILQKTSRGVMVAEPTRRDIVELYELREALEVFAIGKIAARGLDSHELEQLELLVTQVREAAEDLKCSGRPVLKGEALQRFLTADLRFHMRLIQAGGNERMLKVLDSTNLLLRIFTLRREHHTLKLLQEGKLGKYVRERNAGNILLANIESVAAIEALDDILAVPDLDGVLIGPHDLSCSLGIPEEYGDPLFENAVAEIISKARAKNVGVGVHNLPTIEQEIRWKKAGLNLVLHLSDVTLVRTGLSRNLQTLRQATGEVTDGELATVITI